MKRGAEDNLSPLLQNPNVVVPLNKVFLTQKRIISWTFNPAETAVSCFPVDSSKPWKQDSPERRQKGAGWLLMALAFRQENSRDTDGGGNER